MPAPLFHAPQHPYTAGLLAAIPAANRAGWRGCRRSAARRRCSAPGRPTGCAFRPRCDLAFDRCHCLRLWSERVEPGHLDRCWLPRESKSALLRRPLREALQ